MSRRMIMLLVSAVLAVSVFCLTASWADEESTASVVKYLGSKTGSIDGQEHLVVVVGPRRGTGMRELFVPNRDKKARKADPPGRIVDLTKELKPGDLVRVTTFISNRKFMLDDMEKYETRPGEDDPHAYEFVEVVEEKIGGAPRVGVKLKKDEKTVTVWIPKVKDAQGDMVHDEALMTAAKNLREGDIVEVRLQGAGPNATLKGIWEYKAPEVAEFVKTSEQKVGDVTYLTVELNKGDQAVTVLVPAGKNAAGAMVRDQELVAKLRGIRPRQMVEYKSRQDDGQEWLVDIKPTTAKRPPASRPATEKAPG